MKIAIANFLLFFCSVVLACEHDDHDHAETTHRHLENIDGSDDDEECGFIDLTPAEKERDVALMRKWAANGGGNADAQYEIPVYFHIISPDSNEMVSDERIQDYVDYINNAFSDNTVFSFAFQGTTRTENESWADNCADDKVQSQYKNQLKVGGKDTMNVYICNSIPNPQKPTGSFAGFAYLPGAFIDSNSAYLDGVVLARTFEGDERRLNTLVHEIGHYLGLLHTFQDGCDTSAGGDFVSDTPRHISDARNVNCFSDPSGWDTCPLLAGKDPVDNYMTYSNDNKCRTQFTAGQSERMRAQYETYRFVEPGMFRDCENPDRQSCSCTYSCDVFNPVANTTSRFPCLFADLFPCLFAYRH